MILYDKFFEMIKNKGISTYALIQGGVITPGAMQRMRKNAGVTVKTIDVLCKALDCQPGDLMEYIPNPIEEENKHGT